LRDFAVSQALRRERGDAILAGRQRLRSGKQTPVPARPGTRCHELSVRAIGEAAGSDPRSLVESGPQNIARLGPYPRAAEPGTQLEQRARALEPALATLERRDGLPQHLDAVHATDDRAERSQ